MTTYRIKDKDIQFKTYLIDAEGKTLGRMATKVAAILMGKDKPHYTRDQLVGDSVVIINAKKVHVTGKKKEQKIYTHYTGYNSGLRSFTFDELMEKHPDQIIYRAVTRMLPKNKLGSEMRRRIRIYPGAEHEQQAQKPEAIEV